MFSLGNGVAAHRGNMSVFPENTIASFESAVNLGCSWIELDIQKTLDGKIVVTHDANTIRVTGQDYVVTQTDYAMLAQLNFAAYKQNNTFQKLPLLTDVFDLIKGKNTRITIQPKCNGVVNHAINLANKMGVKDQIAFNELNCEYLVEAKQIDSSIPVFWDRLPDTNINIDIFIAEKFGFECLMYVYNQFSKDTFMKIKNRGIECGVCVVNDSDLMDMYLSWGVKMFYTDYPQILLNKI
jgi:glycerophosphoryl diester phosphodiesterase